MSTYYQSCSTDNLFELGNALDHNCKTQSKPKSKKIFESFCKSAFPSIYQTIILLNKFYDLNDIHKFFIHKGEVNENSFGLRKS